MDKTTTYLIVAAIALYLLFLRRPTTTVAMAAAPAYDAFGRPVPGPSYAVSPPTAAHSTTSDLISAGQAAANIGFGIWDRLSNGSGGSSSLPPTLSDNSSGLNLDSYV